jgi:hypothetical protein
MGAKISKHGVSSPPIGQGMGHLGSHWSKISQSMPFIITLLSLTEISQSVPFIGMGYLGSHWLDLNQSGLLVKLWGSGFCPNKQATEKQSI